MIFSYWTFLSRYPRYLLFVSLHTFFSSFGQTFFFALFVVDLNVSFGLTESSSGAIYGGVTLLSAFVLLFTGPLFDRVNVRRYSVCVTLCLGTGALLMSVANSTWQLILAWLMMRHCGQGLMTLIANGATVRFFTVNRGKALGLKGVGIALGEAILPTLVALLLLQWGWRVTFAISGLLCVVVMMPLSLYLVRENDPFADAQATEPGNLKLGKDSEAASMNRAEMLRTSYFWFTLPAVLLMPFAVTGFFFHQHRMAAEKGWDLAILASMFVGYGLCRLLGTFCIGPQIDRWGALRLLPIVQVPFGLGLVLLLTSSNPVVGYAYLALTGMSLGLSESITSAMFAEAYGRQFVGSIKSFVGTLVVLTTALSPPVCGWLLSHGVSIETMVTACLWLVGLGMVLVSVASPPVRQDGVPRVSVWGWVLTLLRARRS